MSTVILLSNAKTNIQENNEMSEAEEIKIKLTNKKRILVQDVVDYIYSLSKEMNIIGTEGVIGNELELIALVRNCKFLYDRNQPDFKDIRKKNAAWNAIATVMNASVQDVQQRWRCLRETYNKYKKEIENADTIEIENVRLWEYYEDMKFIEPYIVHRRSTLSKFNVSSITDDECDETSRDDNSSMLYFKESSADISKFISAVEARPIIYDNKNFEFKNKDLKKETWKEISQTFGITIDECESKWKRLRERYGRERKLLQKGDNDGKYWQYFDELSFLDSFVKPRRPSVYVPLSNKPQQPQDEQNLTSSNAENTLVLKPERLQNPIHIGGAVTITEVRNMEFLDEVNTTASRCSSSSAQSENQISRSVQLSPVPDMQHSLDEDDMFGQMIAAELKAMSRGKKKMKLKADMYRLLYENESDD